MKSNYKALGTFIEPVNQLNDGMEVKELLGISNQKFFQNSHTNTIDIDLQTYRIVRTNQFAYNRATTRNGDKISIALRQGGDCIVSPSYRIFRSKDENELNSEYLMMWFRRPEFDRYARFKSHGSAHEFFEYDQMCQVELPIPQIDKQREIVKEYNTIQNRIALNEQMIKKLEETAQAIYNDILNENPCEEYKLKDLCSFQEGYVNPSQEHTKFFNGNIKWLRANDVNGGFIFNTSRTLTEEGFKSAGTSALLFSPQTIVITKSGTIGRLGILCDYMCGNRAVINIKPKENNNLPLIFFFLKSKYNELVDMAVGSAQANLYVPILATMNISIPEKKYLTHFNLFSNNLLELMKLKTKENEKLEELKDLLLAKMTKVEY